MEIGTQISSAKGSSIRVLCTGCALGSSYCSRSLEKRGDSATDIWKRSYRATNYTTTHHQGSGEIAVQTTEWPMTEVSVTRAESVTANGEHRGGGDSRGGPPTATDLDDDKEGILRWCRSGTATVATRTQVLMWELA